MGCFWGHWVFCHRVHSSRLGSYKGRGDMVVGTEKVSSNLTMFEVPPSAMAAETEGEGMYGLPDKFIVF